MNEGIPEGWTFGDFGEIAKVASGFAFKSKDFTDDPVGNHAVIRMSNLKTGKVDLTDAKYVGPDAVKGLDRFELSPGDFLFGMSGSLDNYGWISKSNGPCYLNQRVGKLVSNNSEDPYAAYLFLSETVRREIEQMAAGAAQLNISAKQVESIPVLAPPKPEQQKIASILTSVDEVIEKTEAQVSKLQDLKKGMMQELMTKGIGHTEFKDSPVGRIPKEWDVQPIKSICTDVVDCVNKTAPVVDYPTPFKMIRTTNVRNGEVDTENVKYVSEETYKIWTRRLVSKDGDLVFTREAPVGESGILRNSQGVFLGQRTMLYRADPQTTNITYLMYSLHGEYCKKQLEDFSGGSTTPHMRVPDCERILIKAPPIQEQNRIASVLSSVDKRIEALQVKKRKIESQKKALMQDLLTGKVRVKVN